jgi:hypothetical protein
MVLKMESRSPLSSWCSPPRRARAAAAAAALLAADIGRAKKQRSHTWWAL